MIDHQERSSIQLSDFLAQVSLFSSDKIGAWLLAIIHSTMDGVIITDSMHQIVLLNIAAEHMFGYTEKQILGKPLDMLLSVQARAEHGQSMERLASGKANGKKVTKTTLNLEGMRANGEEFPITVVISRVVVRGEIYMAIILRETAGPQITVRASMAPSASRKRAMSSQQANEVEKRRVSRELYDDLGQRLSVLKLDMDWLEKSLPNTDKLSPARIAQMQGLLDNIISRTKSIASSLRPPLLDDFGLLPAVSWLAENFQKKTSVTCEVESNGMTIKPGDPVDSAIFRVVQEGLLNIERHANAKNVRIILWHADGRIDVIIQDDGIGMAVGSENKTGCFGLNAMQERIFNLGGTINVKNIDPRGVAIHASIPVEPFPHTVSTS
ncbi:MAG: domain S-box protein [Herminiimonas sp.]|nr:domain S-box protein [Herminiimonas sp.]